MFGIFHKKSTDKPSGKSYANLRCVIAINKDKIGFLIKMLNRDEADPFIVSLVHDSISQYDFYNEPGIYTTEITFNTKASELRFCNIVKKDHESPEGNKNGL